MNGELGLIRIVKGIITGWAKPNYTVWTPLSVSHKPDKNQIQKPDNDKKFHAGPDCFSTLLHRFFKSTFFEQLALHQQRHKFRYYNQEK